VIRFAIFTAFAAFGAFAQGPCPPITFAVALPQTSPCYIAGPGPVLTGVTPTPSVGPIALIGSVTNNATGGVTTAVLNTNGATLLTVCAANGTNPNTGIFDVQGNIWNTLPQYGGTPGGMGASQLFYAYEAGGVPLSTGVDIVSRDSLSGTQPYVIFAAWSGTRAFPDDPLDTGRVAGSANLLSVATIATGPITPSASGELIASCFGAFDGLNPYTVTGGLTITNQSAVVTGVRYGGAFGYLVQATAAAINPSWALASGSDFLNAGIAAFAHP
jgi:hypothetical protein